MSLIDFPYFTKFSRQNALITKCLENNACVGDCLESCTGLHNNNRNKQVQRKEEEQTNTSTNPRGQHWMSSLVSTFRTCKNSDKKS